MNSFRSRSPRRAQTAGFTLIELLLVIAVIGVLASITFGISKGVQSAKNRASAKADLAVLAQALESYKLTHGDYPWTSDGDVNKTSQNAEVLFQSLLGWKAFERSGSTVSHETVAASDVPSDGPKRFIDPDALTYALLAAGEYVYPSDDDAAQLPASANSRPDDDLHFVDPWGQPYVYVYGKKAGASNSWEIFGYHLYSVGPDGEQNAGSISSSSGVMNDGFREAEGNLDNIYSGE